MAASPDRSHLQSGARPRGTSESPGFDIRLPSAQLGDLIQINCLNRVRGAFRIVSGPREGYLFFDGGQLVHAELGSSVGLDAVVQMLGLPGGSVEPAERPWPRESTIDMGADALLLHAAQRIDEQAGERAPCDPGPGEVTTKVVRRVGADEPARKFWSTPPTSAELAALAVAVLSPAGTIKLLRSGATPDLADTAFYALQLGGMIGDALGLGDCRAASLEAEPGSLREDIVVFKGRSIVAARGQPRELAFILERVGLA